MFQIKSRIKGRSAVAAMAATLAVVASSLISVTPSQAADETVAMYLSAPLVQGSHVSGAGSATEDFNLLAGGNCPASTAVGSISATQPGDCIIQDLTGAYRVFGGASQTSSTPSNIGTGSNYIGVPFYNSGSEKAATFTFPAAVKYVGLWWSGGNAGNAVRFLDSSDRIVAELSSNDIVSLLGSAPNPYPGTDVVAVNTGITYPKGHFFGNPKGFSANPPTGASTEGSDYVYAYLNLFLTGNLGVTKMQVAGPGFEFDNVTISTVEQTVQDSMVKVVEKTVPPITWAPTTNLPLTASPATPSSLATSSASGTFSYSVANAGSTSCSVDSSTGIITYSAEGDCVVRTTFTPSNSGTHFSATKLVTFNVSSRLSQSVTWAPTTSLLITASPSTPSAAAATSGDGAISYSVTSAGGTGCSVDALTGVLTYSAVGTCVVRATAAQTAQYNSATADVSFVISAPVSVPQPPAAPEAPAIIAPPTVEAVEVMSRGGSKVSLVKVRVGERPANAPKANIRVKLFDFNGKLLQELTVPVTDATSILEIPVELARGTFQVEAVAVNSAGVSGAVFAKPRLVKQNHFTVFPSTKKPVLAGTVVGTPVYFAANSAQLSSAAKAQLDKLAVSLKASNSRVALTGFASRWSKGRSTERDLAAERALAVANYLQAKGLENWIYYNGFGSLPDSQSKTQERKVELRVIG